ncbi:beta,beta-carotene 9',10'-oxygenase [Plakobranchus ocellatus]|uniref:Beta,beta-carotene 9',10'-oxygenase n=1 Tax=Plakobranchus ocellatus TaxID=259542 RepID=A0AAV4AXN2_9GAST|nr:beta,beta-carotene 9',10'-oxygenase [Plakobranchus ocellatus]
MEGGPSGRTVDYQLRGPRFDSQSGPNQIFIGPLSPPSTKRGARSRRNPQQGDLRLSGPPSGQDAGGQLGTPINNLQHSLRGVILCTLVANTSDQHSSLVVLDAGTFKELGRATLPKQVRMSYTFHGTFTNKLV